MMTRQYVRAAMMLAIGCYGPMAKAAAVSVRVTAIEELNAAEPYPALLHHDGGVWVGTSRSDEGIAYRLRRYDSNGVFQSEVALLHTVGAIYPLGPNRVMVVGKSYRDEWRTHYSEVTLRGGALRTKSYRFSRSWQVEEFAGDAKRWFFTDPGSRSVVKMGNFGPSKLQSQISAPGVMALVGDALYVLERNAFGLGDENLVRIDLKTSKEDTRVFGYPRSGLTSMIPIAGGGRLALAETLANQVIIVDAGLARQTATVAIPAGHPRALAVRGHCLVVGTDDASRKVLTFVDTRLARPVVVGEWDLGSAPNHFKSVFKIAVDPQSRRVFARSHEACFGCATSSNWLVMAEPPANDPAAVCDR